MRSNGIAHLTTGPYFPTSNGQAERFVQTMKNAPTAAKSETGSLKLKLPRFLLAYRNAPHALLNESPAMIFLKLALRSRLDLIHPKVEVGVKKKF